MLSRVVSPALIRQLQFLLLQIVGDQYVRLPHDPYNSRNDLVDRLKEQGNDNEI